MLKETFQVELGLNEHIRTGRHEFLYDLYHLFSLLSVPETKRCSPEGLFYDDRIKGCQWADQLGCKSEGLLNFKCPSEDEDNPYWPYPRYYHTAQDVIVCVNEQPRLVHCNEDQLVDPGSLACMEVKKKKMSRPL